MRTFSVSTGRVWRQVNDNLEELECVAAGTERDQDAAVLARAWERHAGGISYFEYEVDGQKDWEKKRSEAMQRAEDTLDGLR